MRELISYKPPSPPPVKKTHVFRFPFFKFILLFYYLLAWLARKAAKAGTAAGVTAAAKTQSI